jgi:hypothetical protein
MPGRTGRTVGHRAQSRARNRLAQGNAFRQPRVSRRPKMLLPAMGTASGHRRVWDQPKAFVVGVDAGEKIAVRHRASQHQSTHGKPRIREARRRTAGRAEQTNPPSGKLFHASVRRDIFQEGGPSPRRRLRHGRPRRRAQVTTAHFPAVPFAKPWPWASLLAPVVVRRPRMPLRKDFGPPSRRAPTE